jgi:hypothetical protein
MHDYDYFGPPPIKTVDIPFETYESMNGRYFIGYADGLKLGKGKSAWARLYNPRGSGVNLLVNVWTVTDISEASFRAQFWFNSTPPLGPYSEAQVTPANTAYRPTPINLVKLQMASNVSDNPMGGIKAFVRRGEPGTTLVETENGKLIFPPGGNFMVYLTIDDDVEADGRVAFGWIEERV